MGYTSEGARVGRYRVGVWGILAGRYMVLLLYSAGGVLECVSRGKSEGVLWCCYM